jgi:prepilin-type N-terminal cleavage/methylation domain-containing protein
MKTNKKQIGFTLLELLMVVSIMSATAYVALSTLDNDGNNQRYQETVSRLETITQAVIGPHFAAVSGQGLQSGYVMDNGRLPAIDEDSNGNGVLDAGEDTNGNGLLDIGIDDLTRRPVGFIEYGLQAPRFDSSPDSATGVNNDDGVELDADEQKLLKGYRNSAYLNLKPGTRRFQDGWGYDWITTQPSAASWQVLSYGLNHKAGGGELFDTDISQQINSSHWQVDLAGWQVQVENQSATDISVAPGECLRLSLLVFINSDNTATPNQQWKRLTSHCIQGNAVTGSCLDGDGNNLVNGGFCPMTASVTFPGAGGGVGNFQPPTDIPQGEHLLVLVKDTDASDAHNDDSETIHSLNVSKKVRFYAGVSRPDVTLVIR